MDKKERYQEFRNNPDMPDSSITRREIIDLLSRIEVLENLLQTIHTETLAAIEKVYGNGQ